MIRRLLLALLVMVPLAMATDAQNSPARTLTVFAASSLADAFTEVGQAFEAANPGVKVVFNFAGSTALAEQILAGAPADVFASANWPQMARLVPEGLFGAAPAPFANNQLALIVPAANPGGVQTVRDLASSGLLLVLPVSGVPARVYADSLLSRIASAPTYGPDWLTAVYANLVSEEDNVRLAQVKVALGEADAGIVYTSDLTPDIRDTVTAIPLPPGAQPLISYPIAPLRDAADPELAAAFIAAVRSPEGQAVLQAWGFEPAAPVRP